MRAGFVNYLLREIFKCWSCILTYVNWVALSTEVILIIKGGPLMDVVNKELIDEFGWAIFFQELIMLVIHKFHSSSVVPLLCVLNMY